MPFRILLDQAAGSGTKKLRGLRWIVAVTSTAGTALVVLASRDLPNPGPIPFIGHLSVRVGTAFESLLVSLLTVVRILVFPLAFLAALQLALLLGTMIVEQSKEISRAIQELAAIWRQSDLRDDHHIEEHDDDV